MACKPIKLKDGTVILADVKPGQKLTKQDEKILAEWVEFVKARAKRKKPKK